MASLLSFILASHRLD